MKKEKLKLYLKKMQAIKDYIASKGMELDGRLVARYFQKRGWLVDGKPYVSIEQLIERYQKSGKCLREKQERNKIHKEKRKEKKKIKEKERKNKYFSKQREENKKKNEIAAKKKSKEERDRIINLRLPLSYDEQLVDRRWKEFREKVLKHNGRICENCGAKINLQIHHPRYIEGRYAWEYSIDEVVVLCERCHKLMHNII